MLAEYQIYAIFTLLRDAVLVERSRSGKGAHLWIFFEEALLAKVARRFGAALLTKGVESVNLKNFKYYDKMLPLQDYMPTGGLGNLVVLPLQGQALKNGNSAFIDEEWNAYPNQWEQLGKVEKLSQDFIENRIKEMKIWICRQYFCLIRYRRRKLFQMKVNLN